MKKPPVTADSTRTFPDYVELFSHLPAASTETAQLYQILPTPPPDYAATDPGVCHDDNAKLKAAQK